MLFHFLHLEIKMYQSLIFLSFIFLHTHANFRMDLNAFDGDFYFGAIHRDSQLKRNEYRKINSQYANILSPKTACTMNVILTEPGVYDFRRCDQFLNYAFDNQLHIRGPALNVFSIVPDFVRIMTANQKEKTLMDYVERVLTYYRDHENNTELADRRRIIISWDVVSEVVESETVGLPLLKKRRQSWQSNAVRSNLRTDDNAWVS